MAKSTTLSAAKTKELGAMLARAVLWSPASLAGRSISHHAHGQADHAFVLALQGELGTGKTTFAQGFAKGLGVQERVLSPTFVISRRFRIPRHSLLKSLFHIDCYRFKKPSELLLIGWKDILKDPSNIVVLEWPERVKRLLPKNTTIIRLSHAGNNKRTVSVRRGLASLAPRKQTPPPNYAPYRD